MSENIAGVHVHDKQGGEIAWVSYSAVKDTAQRDANARLIAAAPDLYECLFEAIQDHPCWKIPCGDPTCVVTRVRAALAKVEGRA